MLEQIVKTMKRTFVGPLVAGTLSMTAGCNLFGPDCDINDGGHPSIRFTHVPSIGSHELVEGEVKNVDPSDYKISLYIKVGNTWWMKPYWNRPLSEINECGEFIVDYTTGGIDSQANTINAYLVKKDFVPQYHTLPKLEDPNVIAEISVKR